MSKNFYTGYVIDASIGYPLSDGYINLLDNSGEILSRVTLESNLKWKIRVPEKCVSIEFVFEGYCRKNVKVASLSQKHTHIKLLPNAPVAYIDTIEARPGDVLNLHVHSPRNYKVFLYRNGLKRKLVLDLGSYLPIKQLVPDKSFADSGLNWPMTSKIELPFSLSSGLYSITIEDSLGKDFIFPLVLAPAQNPNIENPSFVVIGNTNTWQAYNIWGGKSRYRNFDKNPFTGDIPLPIKQPYKRGYGWRRIKTAMVRRIFRYWRYFIRAVKRSQVRLDVSGIRLQPSWITEPLSLKRPLPSPWLNTEDPNSCYLDHLAANEWRALAWFEREKFSYHYFSDHQLHRGEIDFDKYKGVILIGHAEYWTKTMYERLYSAVIKNKIPLLNLSGNAIYQEVTFLPDGGISPKHGDFLETCCDSSEVLLTSTDLSVSGFAPFEIQSTFLTHWIFKGVKLYDNSKKKENNLIGTESLIDCKISSRNANYDPLSPGLLRGDMYGIGASGWEIDKLTKKYQNEVNVIAKGLNNGGGADMFLLENIDGRFLFAAPSIAFVSSLLVDKPCSQIVRNVCKKILHRQQC